MSPPPPAVLRGPEVAALLRLSPERFYRRRRRLEAEHGFPRPLPGLGRRWSAAAVAAWLAAVSGHGPEAALDGTDEAAGAPEAAEWRARLDANAGALAEALGGRPRLAVDNG